MQGYGHSVLVSISDSGYTSVPNVRRINDPVEELTFADRATIPNAGDRYRRQEPAWFTPGILEVDALFTANTFVLIRAWAHELFLLWIKVVDPLQPGQVTPREIKHRGYALSPGRNEATTDDDNEQLMLLRFQKHGMSVLTEAT